MGYFNGSLMEICFKYAFGFFVDRDNLNCCCMQKSHIKIVPLYSAEIITAELELHVGK